MTRPISSAEVAVLKRALEVGAFEVVAPEIYAAIPSLQVTANCNCGCATVWFGPDRDATVGHMLANAISTSNGEIVELIVWSQGKSIVGLELVGPPGDFSLPDVSTIRGEHA